jgi:hypothetical protein
MGLSICPHCGFQLSGEAELSDGDFNYLPRTGLSYRGARLNLDPSKQLIIGTLLRAAGRTLPVDALIGAIGAEDSEDGYSLIR